MKNKIENQGIYETLVAQLDRVARHNRQGSIQTKRRYYEAVNRFCAYLADEYHLQKLSNVNGKHLVNYVIHMQDTASQPAPSRRIWRPFVSSTTRWMRSTVFRTMTSWV